MLSLGHIDYLNCVPFFHYLSELGFSGRIVDGVPSELNRLLAEGEIDVSPSSSFEYARNWKDYILLPGQSISSAGPVMSVLLFAPGSLEDLEGCEIALTRESATSVNLLKILLAEFVGLRQVRYRVPEEPVESLIAADRPALLIGDRALREAGRDDLPFRIFDLGELWYRFTGLPFVFALWILRREAATSKHAEVQTLLDQLGMSRQRAFAALPALAAQAPERSWMGEERLIAYWRCMSYDLDKEHLAGLRLFFDLAYRHGLVEQDVPLDFFA
ncbi:MAG TPA: menaquinone biosynthesis protein [Desulfuromonadales bacterium]|nr:menaquinone biosynthesis protein [Desulfuromonadales bacterium]